MDAFQYRPHIDGLRAVAVIIVFLFHLEPDLFPWGYLGVDIFFVISGFVISQSLYKTYLKTGTIKIGQFYLRRFKRLYPALTFMLFGTSVTYFLWGFLWDTNLFIKSAVSSLFAFSNLYYLKQGEQYFHQDLINPLLHTWSLGLEEQFYLVYPVLLLGLLLFLRRFKISIKLLTTTFLIGTITLYMLFVYGEGTVWGNYYSPLARFWELLAGCALFFAYVHRGERSDFGLSLYGLLSILLFVGVIYVSYNYSNIYAETLGAITATTLFIYLGLRKTTWLVSVISAKKLVFFGTLSYSLYLWHMPVIYFANLYTSGLVYVIAALFGTLLMAYVSYRFVELPLRYSSSFDVVIKQGAYGLAGCAVAITLGVVFIGPATFVKGVNGDLNALAAHIKEVNYIERSFALGDRVNSGYFLNNKHTGEDCSEKVMEPTLNEWGIRENCLKKKSGTTLFYLTGDSHAAHFVPMLDSSKVVDDVYFSRFTRQTLIGLVDNPDKKKLLERKDELARLAPEYETIYYISSFHLSPSMQNQTITEADIRTYVETLSSYVRIIFIGPTPLFQTGPQSCVLLGIHCSVERAVDQKNQKEFFNAMSNVARDYENVSVWHPYDVICPAEKCYMYNHKLDHLYYLDDDHLSVEESKRLSLFFDVWLRDVLTEHKSEHK